MHYLSYTHNLVVQHSSQILMNSTIELSEDKKTIIGFSTHNTESQSRRTIAIPGFINLHTHLSYSSIQLAPQELFPWLRELIKIQQMDQRFSPSTNALAGLLELAQSGTTFVVDNTSHPQETYNALKKIGLKGLIGVEVFGSDPSKADAIFDKTIDEISSLTTIEDDDIEFTLSPHASYDVSPLLWQKCIAWCKAHGKRLLTHVAESAVEERWFQDKDSLEVESAKDFWTSINTLDIKLKNWKSYPSSIQYLYQNQLLDSCLLLTHMVHASKADLELVSKLNIPLVTCPRSNLYLKNGLANYDLWQELNLEFGIGTDSKASNQSLDIREELKLIKNLNSKEKFELITSKAAKILGKEKNIGSLEKGMAADFVILEVTKDDLDLESLNIFDLILDTTLTKIKSVIVNGKRLHP